MSQTTAEQNKALVLEAFDTLFNRRDYAAAERYWSPRYIQHKAHIEPSREGLANLIRKAPPELQYEPGVIVAEGDFVIVHGRFSGNGRPASWIAADTTRACDSYGDCAHLTRHRISSSLPVVSAPPASERIPLRISLRPGPLANFWQRFRLKTSSRMGSAHVAVDAFPPNVFGLHDMIGNTREWPRTGISRVIPKRRKRACCIPSNPRGAAEQSSYAVNPSGLRIPRKVLNGGSHLCAPNYCQRYGPAAPFPHGRHVDESYRFSLRRTVSVPVFPAIATVLSGLALCRVSS